MAGGAHQPTLCRRARFEGVQPGNDSPSETTMDPISGQDPYRLQEQAKNFHLEPQPERFAGGLGVSG